MNLKAIRAKFQELRNKGFVPSVRRGPTGIGHTLEHELGLHENNIALPDFGSIELKSFRIGSRRLITLFTLNRTAWNPSASEVVKKFGYHDAKRDRTALYSSVTSQPNTQGLYLNVDQISLHIVHDSGYMLGSWTIKALQDKVIEKMQALLMVKAECKNIDGQEHFWYKEARILSSCNYENFLKYLQESKAIVDIRMHIKASGSLRNHGTGFRIYEDLLDGLYGNHTPLME